ncbi:MAG: phosphatidylinositol-specific phospholipase C domain-containing protein [Bacteroidota bacterium]|nr:phosphatidylinositol-specific phospholipase C domain-containing protein [Bacteroidota bacterium]
MKPYLLIFLLLMAFFYDALSQCNACVHLCDKRYNEVAYLTTHNAYNSREDGFKLPNQEWNITTQLNSGVRALMIDVYNESGQLEVYHAYKALGSKPFIDILKEIKIFMDENENEIVTIILECYASSDKIAIDFENSGLSKYLYTKNSDEEWKTLVQMIIDNTRLVVFSDKNDAQTGQEWYHYIWDYAVETHYSNNKKEDFSCDFNRGNDNVDNKDLFIINHFLTTSVAGVGNVNKSIEVNFNPYFLERVRDCQLKTGKMPNFITVDFYNLGNCREVVDIINNTSNVCAKEYDVVIFPNPAREIVYIRGEYLFPDELSIHSILRQNFTAQTNFVRLSDTLIQLDVSNLNNGIYIIKSKLFVIKFIKNSF